MPLSLCMFRLFIRGALYLSPRMYRVAVVGRIG